MIFVIEGELEWTIHDRVHQLDTGVSMYFDSQYPHSYRGRGIKTHWQLSLPRQLRISGLLVLHSSFNQGTSIIGLLLSR
jgi:glyoxylate utilization-related uncharacterized protein